jgi:hypothetical protein
VKRPVRYFFIFVLILGGFTAAVWLYYLPAPKPVEEIEYKEVVRRVSFTGEESLAEWEEKRLSRNSTLYTVQEMDGRGVVRAVSENSASGLYLKERLSFRDRPYVKWDWKVLKFPSRTKTETLDNKAEFDFAAQFYVLFYSRIILNSRGIQYVWTEQIPRGTIERSPYTNNVRIMVLRQGGEGEWNTEERDIAADYFELFGEELDKDVVAIAFMTDADSTGTTAEAVFADIEIGYLPAIKEETPEEDL